MANYIQPRKSNLDELMDFRKQQKSGQLLPNPNAANGALEESNRIRDMKGVQALQAQNREALLKQKYEILNSKNASIAEQNSAIDTITELEGAQAGLSGGQAATGLAGASALTNAAGVGGDTAIGGTLSGAAAGASIGSLAGPGAGTAIGAGVGATVGLVGGLAASRAKRKQAKAQAIANAQQNISVIEGNAEQNRQSAYAGMLNALRSAFIS